MTSFRDHALSRRNNAFALDRTHVGSCCMLHRRSVVYSWLQEPVRTRPHGPLNRSAILNRKARAVCPESPPSIFA
eukprot:227257-Pleurochrysis_carterae.AAC.1